MACLTGTPAHLMTKIAVRFTYDMATWADPLEQVSMRFLEAVKSVTPTIGGAYQVVRLDAGGTHWISRPPATDPSPQIAAGITGGTISAAVSLTSPTIQVSGAGWTINLDTTNTFKVTNTSNGDFLQVLSAALELQNSGGTASGGFDLRHLSGVDYGEMVVAGYGTAAGTLKVRPLSGTAVGAARYVPPATWTGNQRSGVAVVRAILAVRRRAFSEQST